MTAIETYQPIEDMGRLMVYRDNTTGLYGIRSLLGHVIYPCIFESIYCVKHFITDEKILFFQKDGREARLSYATLENKLLLSLSANEKETLEMFLYGGVCCMDQEDVNSLDLVRVSSERIQHHLEDSRYEESTITIKPNYIIAKGRYDYRYKYDCYGYNKEDDYKHRYNKDLIYISAELENHKYHYRKNIFFPLNALIYRHEKRYYRPRPLDVILYRTLWESLLGENLKPIIENLVNKPIVIVKEKQTYSPSFSRLSGKSIAKEKQDYEPQLYLSMKEDRIYYTIKGKWLNI